MLITYCLTIKGNIVLQRRYGDLSHNLTLSPSFLLHILSIHCLQLSCSPKPDKFISFYLLQLDPLLIKVISRQISVVVDVPQNGSSRPSPNQILHKVLREGPMPELMNQSHYQLFLTELPTKPSRVVKGGEINTSYRDAVGVRMQCHMLQSLPWTHPLNHSVRKSRQPFTYITQNRMELLSSVMFSSITSNVSR